MEDKNTPTGDPRATEETNIDSHPLGAGAGAAAGFTAGALLGSTGGPIGTTVGAMIGTVIGALTGDVVAERIDAAAEDAYWREHHHAQPYATALDPFEDFAPAYRVDYSGYRRGLSFQDREAELRMEYEGGPYRPAAAEASAAPLVEREKIEPEDEPGTMQYNMSTRPRAWEEAREAARAAYERIAQRRPQARVSTPVETGM